MSNRWRILIAALGAILVVASVVFLRQPSPPPATALDDGWTHEDAASAGFDDDRLRIAIEALMDSGSNIHAVVVERHGHLIAERYGRGRDKKVNSILGHDVAFGPAVAHDARSVGKTIIGLLIGTAIGEGRIRSATVPAFDFYPEERELATPARRSITLAHLLTMSSGLAWSEGREGRDDEHHLMWTSSPSHYVLSRPIADSPGRAFNYNSGGNALLADILTRTTGMPWDEYARRRLFEPLGIRDVEWVSDFHGRPMAYTGLRLRPRDMAKIGRLVLSGGMWKGQRLVPDDWIKASLQPRLPTGFDGTSYGYQWWTGTVPWRNQHVRWAAAFGNGGQRIYVVPELDVTVVVTAGAYGDVGVARRIQQAFNQIVASVSDRTPSST